MSVVIPTHDRCDPLRRSLRSALEQRDVDLEVIVVDDGSSDDTGGTVAAIADPRIRLVRHESPLGESAARNRGVAEASGTWVAFLDDDDLWAPEKLTRQLETVRSTGRAWAYGGEVAVDENLHVLSGSPPPPPETVAAALSRYNAVPGSSSSVLVHKDLLASVGPFDTELRRTPDWDLWLRLLRRGLPAAADHPLVAVSVHPGNVSRDMRLLFRELDVIADRHRIDVDRARHHRWAAWTALAGGRRVEAVRQYLAAVARGDLVSVVRAAAVMAPIPWITRRGRPASDAAWIDEAEKWLARFRSLES